MTTANKRRCDVQFQEGDEVVVRTAFLPSTSFAHIPVKICRGCLGLFKVVKVASPFAYQLDLPSHWRIHPTFHVEKLKKFEHSTEFQRSVTSLLNIVEVNGHPEFEVEAIIRH